jgi:hypothetical protein
MPTGAAEVLTSAAEAVEAGVGTIQHAARFYAPGVKGNPPSQMAKEQEAIQRASEKYKVNPAYIWGIFGVETSFGSDIKRSSTGARGPFQFEPETAKQYGYPIGANEPRITNWAAFQKQADATAHFLAAHNGTKDPQGAVKAYNPGEADYLKKVVAAAQSWGKALSTQSANQQETEHVEENPTTPEAGTWAKFGALGLNLILILAGAALLVYGVMVMLRPRDKIPGFKPQPAAAA